MVFPLTVKAPAVASKVMEYTGQGLLASTTDVVLLPSKWISAVPSVVGAALPSQFAAVLQLVSKEPFHVGSTGMMTVALLTLEMEVENLEAERNPVLPDK